jgi:hypothetical protein
MPQVPVAAKKSIEQMQQKSRPPRKNTKNRTRDEICHVQHFHITLLWYCTFATPIQKKERYSKIKPKIK